MMKDKHPTIEHVTSKAHDGVVSEVVYVNTEAGEVDIRESLLVGGTEVPVVTRRFRILPAEAVEVALVGASWIGVAETYLGPLVGVDCKHEWAPDEDAQYTWEQCSKCELVKGMRRRESA